MQSRPPSLITVVFCSGLLVFAGAGPVSAQGGFFGKPLKGPDGGPISAAGHDGVVEAHGSILPPQGERPAQLQVTATIAPGWHIYSITQPGGGPVKTRIKVTPSPDFQLLGDFQALSEPRRHSEPLFDNVMVEEHSGEAIWQAPLKMAQGVDLKTLKIFGAVYAQACAESCIAPQDYRFEATLAAGNAPLEPAVPASQPALRQPQAAAGVAEYRHPRVHATLRGRIEPAAVAPGGKARLLISVTPEPPYHVYALADRDPKIPGSKPTLIGLAPDAGLEFGRPKPSAAPIVHQDPQSPGGGQQFYDKAVTWTIDVQVAADAIPGDHEIRGAVGYQTCTDVNCDLPAGTRFQGVLKVGGKAAASAPLMFSETKYSEASQLAAGNSTAFEADKTNTANSASAPEVQPLRLIELNSAGANSSLLFVVLSSLLGGALLNLMPCVLPVIGLKVLSFAQQGGQSRGRVLVLNLWYTAGLMLVFLVLATLASGAKLKLSDTNLAWGEQFSSTEFNIAMSGLVFAMALSFLGVWEIPLPGFVGSGKATELAAQEGATGAFFKGVMSTILATPCSGPFLGPVFGFTLAQPAYITYLVFTCVGIGMASPYLLIGLFPSLVRWIPKPGMWMDTFKQLMGFVLLGTVVFLFTFLKKEYLVPTFATLIGIWAGCWWIGRTPLTADLGKIFAAWIQGAVAAGAIGWFGFTMLVERPAILPWQQFSPGAPAKLASAGKTVMVDFSAEWCLSCKANLKFAINTEDVRQLVDANGVVPLLADWTDGSPEIKAALDSLHSNSIPVLAFYPAGHPEEVLVLRDLVTKGQVLDALKQAGPSRDVKRTAQNEVR